MSEFKVSIVSSNEEIFSGTADMLYATGSLGEIGIAPGHSPLLTGLMPGPVRVCNEDKEETFFCSGGFIEVQPDVVTVLSDVAERADSMEEQAIKLEDEYKLKISEVRLDIEKSSIDRITKAKLEGEEAIKNAKNISLKKIEESRNNLQSAKILSQIESLTDKEVSEGNDDLSIQIREIAEAIKVKVG